MLTLDLAHLPHDELVDAISHHCCQFGDVEAITLLKPPEYPARAFALISMATRAALEKMIRELGAAEVASMAVIRIEQDAPCIPVSLLKRSPSYASASASA
jgi:hypothetical protein